MAEQPERTCLGCRSRAPKGDLIRLARTPLGVVVDPSGRVPGRGAYVHRSGGCGGLALRGGLLGRALKVSLSPEDVSTVRADLERELMP